MTSNHNAVTHKFNAQAAADTLKRDPSRALVVHSDGDMEAVPMRTVYALIDKGLAELGTTFVVVLVDD